VTPPLWHYLINLVHSVPYACEVWRKLAAFLSAQSRVIHGLMIRLVTSPVSTRCGRVAKHWPQLLHLETSSSAAERHDDAHERASWELPCTISSIHHLYCTNLCYLLLIDWRTTSWQAGGGGGGGGQGTVGELSIWKGRRRRRRMGRRLPPRTRSPDYRYTYACSAVLQRESSASIRGSLFQEGRASSHDGDGDGDATNPRRSDICGLPLSASALDWVITH
jgi:hypothetical protein